MHRKKDNRKKEKTARIKNWILDRESFFVGVLFIMVLFVAIIIGISRGTGLKKDFLEDLVFSKESGFYGSDLKVEIKTMRGGGEIRFNLNGDDINNESAKYSGAIELKVPEKGYKVYALNAAWCEELEGCHNVSHKTYVLGQNLDEDISLDIVSITSSQRNLYDYDFGILVGGRVFDNNSDKGLDYVPGNYNERGDDWIRDANITIFSKRGDTLVDGVYGLQVSGGTSAALGVKSFKVLGNKKYGYKRIVFDFGDGLKVYNSVRLRSGAQDQLSGNIRAALTSRLMNESNFDGGFLNKRVVVFLNGDYYALADMQQNYSDSFLADKYGLLQPDSITKLKGEENVVFDRLGISQLFRMDLNNESNRTDLEKKVDMDNYLKYYALEIMWNNTDWPGNNFEAWKYDNSNNTDYMDGRVRFLIYDTDLTYYTDGNVKYYDGAIGDIFENLMENKYRGEGSTFRNVMESSYYREKFINILRGLMNGAFETNNVLSIINEEAAKIDKQMQLFYTEDEYRDWQGWVELLRKAVRERNSVIRADVEKYFGVSL